jgi:hypothetical protein
MGRQLLDIYQVFLRSIEESGEYLKTLGCEWVPIGTLKRNHNEC